MADDAVISNGGTATISSGGASSGRAINLDVSNGTLNVQTGGELFAANIIRIGHGTSTATVNQTGGLVSVDINNGADLRIGFDAGAHGNYNLSGGELWVDDSLSVGQNGTGVMTMTGGWISHAGFFTVGNNPGANGTFIMHGGTVDQTFGDFEVGDEAVGNVTIDGGTFNVAPTFWFSIGNRPLGTGTATIAGTANVNANAMIVGRNATNTSTLNVNGGTTKITNNPDGSGGDMFVGLNGPGAFNMSAGDVQIADDFVIGHQSTGVATISGGTISKSGWIVIGDEKDSPIDEVTRGTGTLNVTGGTINQSFGDLEIGDAGTGTYNQSGGAVHIADTIYVAKQTGSVGDANVSGGALTARAMANNGTFDASGNGATTLGGGASGGSGFIDGSGAITVADTAVINAGHVRQSSLTMTGGRVNIAPTGTGTPDGVSVIDNYSLSGSARLDLGDNKLLTNKPAGTFTGGAYTGVQGDVAKAYNFGTWDQPGLMTSRPDAGPLVGTTTIGVASAGQILFLGPTETGTFAGQPVTGATTIAMYTYAGDLNFDGLVDAGDYGVIDNSFQFPGTDGYANGDFNYDGIIDAGDYGIIDNTFSLQGAPFSTAGSAGASLFGVTAVPEPSAACGLALLAALKLSTRRRRRRRDHRERLTTMRV